jgi:polar amino acid transport system substrate-binding protein
VQQTYLWYTVVFQIDSILQRIVTNKQSMLLILNNYVSRNLEVGLPLAVQQGKMDLLCGTATATLTRRKEVAFSIPIFPSGIGAILRRDSSAALRDLLSNAPPQSRPIWRGSPARTILESKTFSVVAGTTGESWLAERLNTFQLTAKVVPVQSYDTGIRQVTDRGSDVLFGDRPILLDVATRSPSGHELVVLDRLFTYEPVALALARNDDDFRLVRRANVAYPVVTHSH